MTVYTYNDKVLKNSTTDKWLIKKEVDPYNPLNLPANTIRVRTSDGNAPIKGYNTRYATATLVSGTSDVYDVYKSGTDFVCLLNQSTNVVEVLGANTANITDMDYLFSDCTSLTSVALFDTSACTDMNHMFNNCTSLTSIPLFDTSACTNMEYMFTNCRNVESGALALYQQASSQASQPGHNSNTFRYCGSNTVTGAAELAQIPSSWGGTGA